MTTAVASPTSIVQRDRAQWSKKLDANVSGLILHASRQSGRNPAGIALEMMRAKRGKARIFFDEYVKFGLFDKAIQGEAREAFVGARVQNDVIHQCNDTSWFAVTEDKWLSGRVLAEDGIAAPQTRAIVDPGTRRYAGGTVLRSAEDLRDFLLGGVELPLFGKHNRGLMSVGVFMIENADQEMVYLREQGGMTYHKFFEHVIGKDAFLLQEVVENCAFIRQFTSAAATVRMVSMLSDDGLYVPSAVLKLPTSRNLADNFWRPGNLLCNIDPETGKVLRLVAHDGPGLKELKTHPETDAPLVGETLPHWDRVLEVNARVTELHTPLKYQSTDICITDDGPVVVEVNAGSSFSLPQYASGKGFLTPKVRGIFLGWGVTAV
ncbi:hypothetical protein KUV73_08395 [Mameliella alba]|nr:hypothetical protein [Mameliella alba]MBY6169360.1 hypothetical protein [Mameliella alba]MBY6174379.1 hypothetical protein [Mameliella alba]